MQFKGTDKEREEELRGQEKQSKKNEANANTFSECFVQWSWIETHCNLCAYSVDIRTQVAVDRLGLKMPWSFYKLTMVSCHPLLKLKDGHFMNPIQLLQYCDLLKIPGYDADCPSIDKNMYTYMPLLLQLSKVFLTLTF